VDFPGKFKSHYALLVRLTAAAQAGKTFAKNSL